MPDLNVVENVTLPLLFQGVSQHAAQARARESLALMDIETLAEKLPEELSGGQAQRVSVARVVATRPRLILADEPTGQLDQSTARHVIEVLLQAADELAAGLVVATHDPLIAAHLDHHWVMHEGTLDVTMAGAEGAAASAGAS